MSYNFSKGKYRAKVKTDFSMSGNNATQFAYSNIIEFPVNPITVFRFKTNPNIMLDPNTLEVPNANLVESGTYKGLDYAIYDNGLVIISGEQNESMVVSDVSPWRNNIYYIYTNAHTISGYVYGSDRCRELQHKGRATGSNTIYLFNGTNFELIDVSDFDTSGVTSFGNMFADCTTEILYGVSHFDYSNATDIYKYLSGLKVTGSSANNPDLIFDVRAASLISSGTSYAFDIMAPNCTVTVKVSSATSYMFRTYDPSTTYANNCIGTLIVFIDNPVSDNTSLFTTNRAKNIQIDKWLIDTSLSYSKRLTQTFKNCKYLTSIFTGNGVTFDTSTVTRFDNMFEGCNSLVNVNLGIDFSSATNISNMFSGCWELMVLDGINLSNGHLIITSPVLRNCDSMFVGCTKIGNTLLSLTINHNTSTNNNISATNMFSGSGIVNLEVYFNNTVSPRSEQLDLTGMCKQCSHLNDLTIQFNTLSTDTSYPTNITIKQIASGSSALQQASISGRCLFDATEAFYGCSHLETLIMGGIYASYKYWSVSQYQWNLATVSQMLMGCSNLSLFQSPNGLNDSGMPNPLKISLYKTMYVGSTGYTVADMSTTNYTSSPT